MDEYLRLKRLVEIDEFALGRLIDLGYGPCSARYRARWLLMRKHRTRLVKAIMVAFHDR